MPLINNDGDSLDCEHYASDVFDANTGILWHCDDEKSIKLVIYQKEVIKERVTKKRKKVMSSSTELLFVVYIRTSHLKI